MTEQEQAFFLGRAWEAMPEPKQQFVFHVVRPDDSVYTIRVGPHTVTVHGSCVAGFQRLWTALVRAVRLS